MEHVHQHPAARLARVVAPGGPVSRCAGDVDDAQPIEDRDLDGPDVAGTDDLQDPHDLGTEQVVVDDPVSDTISAGRGDHLRGIARSRRDRLFREDVATRLAGRDDEVAAEMLRGAHVDHVDVVARKKLSGVGMDVAIAKAGCVAHERTAFGGRVSYGDQPKQLG